VSLLFPLEKTLQAFPLTAFQQFNDSKTLHSDGAEVLLEGQGGMQLHALFLICRKKRRKEREREREKGGEKEREEKQKLIFQAGKYV